MAFWSLEPALRACRGFAGQRGQEELDGVRKSLLKIDRLCARSKAEKTYVINKQIRDKQIELMQSGKLEKVSPQDFKDSNEKMKEKIKKFTTEIKDAEGMALLERTAANELQRIREQQLQVEIMRRSMMKHTESQTWPAAVRGSSVRQRAVLPFGIW